MFISSLFNLFFFVVALFSIMTAAAPITGRDVYVPPVTYPKNGTIWKTGSTHNVTWDTSNPPPQITNKMGRIVLAKAGRLQIDRPLALDFDILAGHKEVTVPDDIEPGVDYSVVLFGDSGNHGGRFTIITA